MELPGDYESTNLTSRDTFSREIGRNLSRANAMSCYVRAQVTMIDTHAHNLYTTLHRNIYTLQLYTDACTHATYTTMTDAHTYIYIYMCVCMYVCMYIYIYRYVYIYIHTHICVYTQIYKYIYIYIYIEREREGERYRERCMYMFR